MSAKRFKKGDVLIVKDWDYGDDKFWNDTTVVVDGYSEFDKNLVLGKSVEKGYNVGFPEKHLEFKYRQILAGQAVKLVGSNGIIGRAYINTRDDGKIAVVLNQACIRSGLIYGSGAVLLYDANDLEVVETDEFVGESKPAFVDLVEAETARSIDLHGDHKSLHESYGILMEEVEEFWDEVKLKSENRDKERIKAELVQIASVAMKAWIFVDENM